MISAMDTNGDGSISQAEFVAARPADVSESQAEQLFQSFDKANTGSLTVAQLGSAMHADHAGHQQASGGQLTDDELSSAFSSRSSLKYPGTRRAVNAYTGPLRGGPERRP